MPLRRTLLTSGLQDWTQPPPSQLDLGAAAGERRQLLGGAMRGGPVARHAENSLEGVTNIALFSSPAGCVEKRVGGGWG